jgi:hypothetical protein
MMFWLSMLVAFLGGFVWGGYVILRLSQELYLEGR